MTASTFRFAAARSGLRAVRTAFALAACLSALPVLALPALAQPLVLRGEVTASRDTLTLADLVEGAPAAIGATPVFRAPALGQTGVIQVRRVVEAVEGLGLPAPATGGRVQVSVSRAARRVGLPEIEAAVKAALESRHGLDARFLSLVFDGQPPSLLVAPEIGEAATAEDVSFDPRSQRVAALVTVGAGERRTSLRVAAAAIELAEVAVAVRALNRGDTVKAGDVAIERRPKHGVPSDVETGAGLDGRVARRALPAGTPIRAADLARPEIVARNEGVTIVYEIPGMTLTVRGRANEAGALGDSIPVLNPQSKKVLAATVTGPGRVSVAAPLPGRVAAVQPARP